MVELNILVDFKKIDEKWNFTYSTAVHLKFIMMRVAATYINVMTLVQTMHNLVFIN